MTDNTKQYMSDGEQSFRDVLIAFEELIDSRYILAESKISELLRKIARSRRAYETIEYALVDFDFEREFTLAKHRAGKDKHTITLPEGNVRPIALAFGVLCDIDTGKCDFKSFLNTFFTANSMEESFSKFIEKIVVPMSVAFEELASENANIVKSFYSDTAIKPEAVERLVLDVNAIAGVVSETDIASDSVSDNIAFALSELSRAFVAADKNIVRLAYIALRDEVFDTEELVDVYDEVIALGEKLIRLGIIPR